LRAAGFLAAAVRVAGAFFTLRLTAFLTIGVSLFLASLFLSLSVRITRTKKIMCKFEHFVDTKLQIES
jgi:hypothetical protein